MHVRTAGEMPNIAWHVMFREQSDVIVYIFILKNIYSLGLLSGTRIDLVTAALSDPKYG
jgi:hypothetical protein